MRSESIAKLLPALIAARGEMTKVAKDAINPQFANKRDGKDGAYATLAACLEACEPALGRHGLAVLQTTRWVDGLLTLDTVLAHSSGEWVSSEYPVICDYNQPQKVGGGVTYARRYSYLAITGRAPEDDDGEAASGRGPNGHASRPAPAPAPARVLNPMEQRNLDSRRRTGQRGHLQEAPAGWGGNGNGNGHAPAPAAPRPEAATTDGPKRGSQLWKWATAVEQERGRGLMAHLEQYGATRGWGTRITGWSDTAVREAYEDALAQLEVIYNADVDDAGDDWDE